MSVRSTPGGAVAKRVPPGRGLSVAAQGVAREVPTGAVGCRCDKRVGENRRACPERIRLYFTGRVIPCEIQPWFYFFQPIMLLSFESLSRAALSVSSFLAKWSLTMWLTFSSKNELPGTQATPTFCAISTQKSTSDCPFFI